MIYVILKKDGSGIVKGISFLSGEVTDENMIKIPDYEPSLIGKKYQDGKFIKSDIQGVVKSVDPMADINKKLDEILTLLKAK